MYRNTAHVYDLIYEAQGKDDAAEAIELRAVIETRRLGARSVLDVVTSSTLRSRRWLVI